MVEGVGVRGGGKGGGGWGNPPPMTIAYLNDRPDSPALQTQKMSVCVNSGRAPWAALVLSLNVRPAHHVLQSNAAIGIANCAASYLLCLCAWPAAKAS